MRVEFRAGGGDQEAGPNVSRALYLILLGGSLEEPGLPQLGQLLPLLSADQSAESTRVNQRK